VVKSENDQLVLRDFLKAINIFSFDACIKFTTFGNLSTSYTMQNRYYSHFFPQSLQQHRKGRISTYCFQIILKFAEKMPAHILNIGIGHWPCGIANASYFVGEIMKKIISTQEVTTATKKSVISNKLR
jgi:hypothetical protein